MPFLSHTNISMIQDPDFQKCGEIMVAPKRNGFAMSCSHCPELFTRLPAFMRHLHKEHMDVYQFQAKDAEVEVYAVEELVNRTAYESEESGVGEEEDSKCLDNDESFKEYHGMDGEEVMTNSNKKGEPVVKSNVRILSDGPAKVATLANMSILDALEDCDVSLNFVENLDETLVDRQQEEDKEEIENCQDNKEKKEVASAPSNQLAVTQDDTEEDEGMDVDENEAEDEDDDEGLDMETTLLKRIQMDLEMDAEEVLQTAFKDEFVKEKPEAQKHSKVETGQGSLIGCDNKEDEDLNVTLTQDNVNVPTNQSPKSKPQSTGFKNLLSGLLESFDISLDNIEDSFIMNQREEELEEMPKSKEFLNILEDLKQFEEKQEEATKSRKNHNKVDNLAEELEAVDDLDDLNLNASILRQCLADDDDDVVDAKEHCLDSQPKSANKVELDKSRLSALELKCMAGLDMDENVWKDCLGKEDKNVEQEDKKSSNKDVDQEDQTLANHFEERQQKTPKIVKRSAQVKKTPEIAKDKVEIGESFGHKESLEEIKNQENDNKSPKSRTLAQVAKTPNIVRTKRTCEARKSMSPTQKNKNDNENSSPKSRQSCQKFEQTQRTPPALETLEEAVESKNAEGSPRQRKSIKDALTSTKHCENFEQIIRSPKILKALEDAMECNIIENNLEENKTKENILNSPKSEQSCNNYEQALRTPKILKALEKAMESSRAEEDIAEHKTQENLLNSPNSGQSCQKVNQCMKTPKTSKIIEEVINKSASRSPGQKEAIKTNHRDILCTPKSTKTTSKSNKTPVAAKTPRTSNILKPKEGYMGDKTEVTENYLKANTEEDLSSPKSDRSPTCDQNFKKTEQITPKTSKTPSTKSDKTSPKSAKIIRTLVNVTPKSTRTPSLGSKLPAIVTNNSITDTENCRDNAMTPKTKKESLNSPDSRSSEEVLRDLKADLTPKTTKTSQSLQKANITPESKKTPEKQQQNPEVMANVLQTKSTPDSKKTPEKLQQSPEEVANELQSERTPVKTPKRLQKAASLSPGEEETDRFEEGLSEDQSSTRMYEENKETENTSKQYLLENLLAKNLDDEEDLDTLINQLETSTQGEQTPNKSLGCLNMQEEMVEIHKTDENKAKIDTEEDLGRSNTQSEVYHDNKEKQPSSTANESLNSLNKSHEMEELTKITESEPPTYNEEDMDNSNIQRALTSMNVDPNESVIGLHVTEISEDNSKTKDSNVPSSQDENIDDLIKKVETSINEANDKDHITKITSKTPPFRKDDNEEEDNDDCLAEQMSIFNKFIGLNSKETQENEEIMATHHEDQDAEEDIDNFENLLNADLAKALEQALGDDNMDTLMLEEEEVLDTNNKIDTRQQDVDLKITSPKKLNKTTTPKRKSIQKSPCTKKLVNNPLNSLIESREETNQENSNAFEKDIKTSLIEEKTDMAQLDGHEADANKQHQQETTAISPSKKLKTTPIKNSSRKSIKKSLQTPVEDECPGKYSKTNRKAKHIQGKPVKVLENALKESNQNKITFWQTNKKPLNSTQQQKTILQLINVNHVASLQQQEYAKSCISPQKFHASPGTKENSPLKLQSYKTPSTRLRAADSEPLKKIIKKEIITPARCFINTNRGERTPMKLDELLFKQSPKSQEKTAEKYANFLTQRTPEKINCKKSASECKLNFNNITGITPHKSLRRAATVSPANKTTTNANQSSPQKLAIANHFSTPQKTRQLEVKVLRCTPSTRNTLLDPSKNSTNSKSSPPNIQQKHLRKSSSPLSNAERQQLATVFKLPNGITISKVTANTSPTMVEVTPNRSNYCKQNFTEQSLQQHQQQQLIIGQQQSRINESLIGSLPNSLTITKTDDTTTIAKRIRARQASIDVVPTAKTPSKSNLDYKSYAVNRSVRKREVLNRMRTIKKQIFKPIETNSLANAKIVKSPLVKKARNTKIQIENVQILPNVSGEVLTPLVNKHNSSTNEEMMPREMTPKSVKHDDKCDKSVTPEVTVATPVKGESSANTNAAATSPKSPLERSAKSLMTSSRKSPKTPSLRTRRPNKRRASSTPLDVECPAKRLQKSTETPTNEDGQKNDLQSEISELAPKTEEEPMPMDDSTPDHSAEDLKINSKESSKKTSEKETKTSSEDDNASEPNIIDALLEQVSHEETADANEKTDIKQKPTTDGIVEDYNEAKDLELLEKVGLPIITHADIEDFHTLEQVEEMRAKAKKFTDICRFFPRLWNFSKISTDSDLVSKTLTKVNLNLNENITLGDFKRLINLISLWHTNCYNSKLLEKKLLTESTNYYLLMFNFISKTSKRVMYCEFCEQQLNTEHKYHVHRIKHTGKSHPYQCKICGEGFIRAHLQQTHYAKCQTTLKADQYLKQRVIEEDLAAARGNKEVYTAKAPIKKILRVENIVINDQTKGRSRNIYKCAKCLKSFANESEVRLHIKACNSSVKRQPKQSTPRPKPKAESYSSN